MEGAEHYETPEDHTLRNLVEPGNNSSITWAGGGTTVPDPVGLYHRPSRQPLEYCSIKGGGGGTTVRDPWDTTLDFPVLRGNAAVSTEGEGSQQYQTPYDHILYNFVKAGDNSCIT